jgi:hypothetical protein
LDDEVMASARGRIRTCLAYSPAGRVAEADVEIASNQVTEGYVEAILDPESRIERLRAEMEEGSDRGGATRPGAIGARIAAIESRLVEVERDVRMEILRARGELLRDGVPVETYRRIVLDEALGLLASRTAVPAG